MCPEKVTETISIAYAGTGDLIPKRGHIQLGLESRQRSPNPTGIRINLPGFFRLEQATVDLKTDVL